MKAFMDMMIGGLIDALVPGCSVKRHEPKAVDVEVIKVRPKGIELEENWQLYVNANQLPKQGFHTAKKVN